MSERRHYLQEDEKFREIAKANLAFMPVSIFGIANAKPSRTPIFGIYKANERLKKKP